MKHCAFGARGRITVRMADVPPGEVAEIDFGRLGLVPDPTPADPHRRRTAWALVIVLVHSRHQYVHVTFSQTVQAVIDGLEDAWAFFGGVPRRVVLDNLRAAITKADRYDPVFQRTMAEYARHRGFVIDPAPVRQPTGKPHVERGVPYVRENFFRGESWRDLAHVQAAVRTWVCETAGRRVHRAYSDEFVQLFRSKPSVRSGPIRPPSGSGCSGVVRGESSRAIGYWLVGAPVVSLAFLRSDPPVSVMRCALWTSRSRMASPNVASPMSSCQCSTGT